MLIRDIKTLEEMEKIIQENTRVFLYGSGKTLTDMWEYFTFMQYDYLSKFAGVLDSSETGEIYGLTVRKYEAGCLIAGDAVIFAMGTINSHEVAERLSQDGFENVFTVSYHMIHAREYDEVLDGMRPYIDDFERGVRLGINKPVHDSKKHVWCMWWQGEDAAPETVKMCWENQKFFLGDDVERHVITEKNWMEYLELPDVIIKKVEQKRISFEKLSDVFRCCLLYKYGGVWLDTDLLLIRPFDQTIFDRPYFSRREAGGHFGSEVTWGGYFLAGQSGWILYEFMHEMWIRYLTDHDGGDIYHMIDYLIAIATNRYPEVKNTIAEIPINNAIADELMLHLDEPYSKEALRRYTAGCFLTNINNKNRKYCDAGSIYEQIRREPIKIFLDLI